MSLINKMLQDLDARGTPGVDAFPSNVRPVAASARRAPSLRLIGVSAAGAVAGTALAWLAWGHFHAERPDRPAAAPAASAPVAAKAAQGLQGTIAAAPAATEAPAAKVAPPGAVEPQAAAMASAPVPVAAPPQQDAGAEDVAFEPAPQQARKHHEDDEPARAHTRAPEGEAARRVDAKSVLPTEPDSPEAREARRAAAIELATRGTRMARLARLSASQAHGAAAASKAKPKAGTGMQAEGRQESPVQRAEGDYRRALASLQEGRMGEAIASLQQALRADPGHDAARQTLVGLLVESGRTDDAIRELQLGLAQDPRQPALAMLLARLQIEHGGSGIETLMRTLPYAGNNTAESAEYHGFLAGALQRQQRHREAAAEYQQALRAAPGNGVWWMGLGISLQADKRNNEALDAFQRARASAGLNAELQAFVERRIQLLAR
jgi:MSHA biogenesis protein MshN